MTDYVELHAHSYYSLKDGASSPEALVAQAAALGMPALALTDHDAVYGAVNFVEAARAQGIQPILGAELTIGDHHLTLLVAEERGWHNLCWLISQARHAVEKGEAKLPPRLLSGHTEGLIALSGCRHGRVSSALLVSDEKAATQAAQEYVDLFGRERFWIELQHHLLPEDKDLICQSVRLAERLGLGYVATNNVHYATAKERRLQDVLVSLQHLTPLAESEPLHRPNAEYYLKSPRQMAELFRDYPLALRNTLLIAEQCQYELRYGLQDLPRFPTPDQVSTADYLRQHCEEGLRYRYGTPSERVRQQLNYELDVITKAGLDNYFLIVWDICRFARQEGIRCQGRGSAANSLIAYLLQISPVDPLKYDLVFERFLSPERQMAPDIDIDFQADRREEVIQYIYGCYGRDHAAMACTYITFRRRSAIRDVGKLLDLPPELLGELADRVDFYDETVPQPDGKLPLKTATYLYELANEIKGLPRHLGIHNGGMVITRQPLAERLPTEPARMEERTVVQWDKEALEMAGLVKLDILGLRMLSAVAEALRIIQQTSGESVDLDRLSFADPAVFDMITAGDTVGVFQVESRAQSQMLPRFRPTRFEDLVIAISLIRPGPIQGDMVHPFLRRRLGLEEVTYFHDSLKGVLAETLGVILFQEQVLKVAHALAGFTPGQGELLRRALSSKHAPERIASFHDQFIAGAIANGVEQETAETVFEKLLAFGGYSFPKSHAAAFAVLVYQSAWLKRYHPRAFFCGILNQQPMGFYTPAVVVNDVKRHQIPVLPVDVNRSQATCAVEDDGIRIGFNYVKGFGDTACNGVVEARAERPFADLQDFCQRTRLSRRLVEHLILVGAFDAWGRGRRQLLWDLDLVAQQPDMLALDFDRDPLPAPELTRLDERSIEFELLGISIHEHPLQRYRDGLAAQQILGSAALEYARPGSMVAVAGINVVHQAPPTAKGFHFVTLEDESGFMNVIFRPHVYGRFRRIVHATHLLYVEGQVEREGDVINVMAQRVQPLAPILLRQRVRA